MAFYFIILDLVSRLNIHGGHLPVRCELLLGIPEMWTSAFGIRRQNLARARRQRILKIIVVELVQDHHFLGIGFLLLRRYEHLLGGWQNVVALTLLKQRRALRLLGLKMLLRVYFLEIVARSIKIHGSFVCVLSLCFFLGRPRRIKTIKGTKNHGENRRRNVIGGLT